uniref:VPS37 C-terminal domain-containing protein n=1 Tax=Timema shepardi TaxID=629360 RepID=A0A7R9AUB1_TIMSH|nr:unnamed protein product [Timema shepardi]
MTISIPGLVIPMIVSLVSASVTEVQEDLEYKVDFLAGGVNMVLLVSLSPDFPLDKPVLKVQPLVIHPWVNDHSEIVSAPGLLNAAAVYIKGALHVTQGLIVSLQYTVHSDLGRVVQAIISEFSRNPPPVALGNEAQGSLPVGQTLACSPSLAVPLGYVAKSRRWSVGVFPPGCRGNDSMILNAPQEYLFIFYTVGGSEVSTDQSSSLTRFPQVTGSYMGVYPPQSPVHTVNTLTFPELLDLTTEELRTLNNSEDRQQDWVESMPQCARLNAELDALIERTQELAEENLRKKPELSRLRKETEGKLAAVKSLKNSFDSLSQEFQRRSEIYAPENIRSPCSVPPSPLYPPVSLLSYPLSVDMAVRLVAIYWDVLLVLSLICTVDLDKLGRRGQAFTHTFTTKSMVTAFHCIQEGLMLADEDHDVVRSARVHRAVMEGLTCYQEIYKEKKYAAKQPTIGAFFQPVAAMRSLQLSALRSDEETESIAEHFLSGDMDVDHFTHLYIDKKMLHDFVVNDIRDCLDLIEDFGEYLPENLGKEFWMQDPFSTVEDSTLPNFFSTKEIIELSCDETHKSSLKKNSLADLWLQRLNKFTHIADHVIKFTHIADHAIKFTHIADLAIKFTHIADHDIKFTHIADHVIKFTHIADHVIKFTHITDHAIKFTHIADHAIKFTNIADLAIKFTHIADHAIKFTHIADHAIKFTHIADHAIKFTHIADLAIKFAHIADHAIKFTHIADHVIKFTHIADLVIKFTHIADHAIKFTHITDLAIKFTHIADHAIKFTHIADHAIKFMMPFSTTDLCESAVWDSRATTLARLSQTRKTKEEKLSNQLKELHRAGH